MSSPVFSARNISYATPGGRWLQKNLDFDVEHGQLLLITGSNGCGKSTLIKALLRQFPLREGSVVCHVPDARVAYIPQLENTEIHLPLTLRDVLNISRREKPTDAEITRFGLLQSAHLSAAWNTASGGERKRTLLTRALLRSPAVLVFDEPMNHLDADSRKAIIQVMADFLRATHEPRAILMVCHQGLSPEERALFRLLPLDLDRLSGATA